MKTIALYDFNWHGHHPTYLDAFASSLLKNNHRVVLFCQFPEIIIEKIEKHFPSDKVKNIQGFKLDYPQGNGRVSTALFQSLLNWQQCSRDLSNFETKTSLKIDLVFLLKLEDYCRGFIPLALFENIFKYKWAGLFIHLDIPKKMSLQIKHQLKQCLTNLKVLNSKTCRLVGTLQEDCLKEFTSRANTDVIHFPEITYEERVGESSLINSIRQKARGRKIISLPGLLERRKGVFTFIEMAKRCQDKDWFFVCCGKADNIWTDRDDLAKLKEIIRNYKSDNCFFHLERIDEAEFNALINISDMIFAVYEDFPPYSSNLLTKTTLFHKPILVNSGSLIASRVRKFNIGAATPSGDINSYITSTEKILTQGLNNPGFDDYFNRNSLHYFNNFINKLITDALK